MGSAAVNTGFYSVLHDKIPSAALAQMIKRTIAEKAVELRFIHPLMTRKIPAFRVSEKSVGIIHEGTAVTFSFFPIFLIQIRHIGRMYTIPAHHAA